MKTILYFTIISVIVTLMITIISVLAQDFNLESAATNDYLYIYTRNAISVENLALKPVNGETHYLASDFQNIASNSGKTESGWCYIYIDSSKINQGRPDGVTFPDFCDLNRIDYYSINNFWYKNNQFVFYYFEETTNSTPSSTPRRIVGCNNLAVCAVKYETATPTLTPVPPTLIEPSPTEIPPTPIPPTPTPIPPTEPSPTVVPPTPVPPNTPLPPPSPSPTEVMPIVPTNTPVASPTLTPVTAGMPLLTGALVNDLVWSPSHTYLAAALSNGDLCVWIRQSDGAFLQNMKMCSPVHGGQVITDIDWDSQGNKIASVGGDKRLRISLVTAEGLVEAQASFYNPNSDDRYNFMQQVDWGADDTTITTAGSGTIDVWDVISGENLYRTSSNTVIRVQGNIQSDKVITIGSDKGLRLIDTERRSVQSLGTTSSVGIDADWATNGLIASLDVDGNLRVYRSTQQDDYVNVAYNLTGVTKARFSKTGRWIAVTTSKGLNIYQASESYHLLTIFESEQPLTHLAWSEDEGQIAASDVQGRIFIWSLPSLSIRLTETNRFIARPAAAIADFTWDREGKRVALVGSDDTFSIWEADTSLQLVLEQPEGFTDPSSIDWSARHNLLAFGDCPAEVLLWDITDFNRPIPANTIPNTSLRTCVSAVAFNASGTLIAIGDQELVRIWNRQKNSEVGIVRVNHPVNDIEWDANQRFIVVSEAGEISIYEWIESTDQSKRIFLRQPNGANGKPIQAVVWSPVSTSNYGKYATAGQDNNGEPVIAVWDTEIQGGHGFNGAYLLYGHLNTIISMSWNSAGQIASLGDDGEIIIWDAATGTRLERIIVPNATHLRWSPLDQKLAVSTSQGEMIFYRFTPNY